MRFRSWRGRCRALALAACLGAATGASWGQGSGAAPAKPDSAAPPPPVSASGQRIFDDTRTKLLQVRTLLKDQDSQASVGSGFVVTADGLAVTNYHVVSQFALRPERYRLSYTMAEGRSGTLELLAIDVIHDLALVRLRPAPAAGASASAGAPQTAAWPTLAFRSQTQPLARGERIFSLGNPLDVGFAIVEGNYNGFVERSYLPQIFFAGSLNPGMSGGPALDAAGRVIGINVAARREGQPGRALHRPALAQRQPCALPRAGAGREVHALLGQQLAG
jgi:serine protease Do